MVEYHIGNESLTSGHLQLHLSAHICKSLSKFEKETGYISRQFIFKLLFVSDLLVNESKIIRTFQNVFGKSTIWRGQLVVKISYGHPMLSIKTIIHF